MWIFAFDRGMIWIMETYRCRPCVKDFVEAGLAGLRRCPQCGGPLLSLSQLRQYESVTLASLNRLRWQSAATMAGTALLMVAMQAVFSVMQAAEVSAFFDKMLLGVAAGSIAAVALWLYTRQSIWMLAGAVLLQTAAAFFFFVMMGVGQVMRLPGKVELFIAALPMAGALLAWHQYRAYGQVMKLEKSKGRGSRAG